MLALYRFDIDEVFAGRVSTSNAYALIARLPFEPMSLYRANQLGGVEHLGWSTDSYLAAEQIDAIMASNALIANQGSKKRPKFPDPVWRPTHKKEPEVAKSILDIPVAAMAKAIGGN